MFSFFQLDFCLSYLFSRIESLVLIIFKMFVAPCTFVFLAEHLHIVVIVVVELTGVVSHNTTDRMLEHMTYLYLKVVPVIGIMELFSQLRGTVT